MDANRAHQACRSSVATASAAIPSPRPIAPMPSLVENFTLTSRAEVERLGQADPHVVAMRAELRRLADHRRVDVAHAPAVLGEEPVHLAEQLDAVGARVALVGVWEVLADVPEAGRSEKRVDHGVGQDVPVGVAEQAALGVLDHHASEDERAALHQAVRVVPDAGALAQPIGSIRRSRPSNTASSRTPTESSSSSASS